MRDEQDQFYIEADLLMREGQEKQIRQLARAAGVQAECIVETFVNENGSSHLARFPCVVSKLIRNAFAGCLIQHPTMAPTIIAGT